MNLFIPVQPGPALRGGKELDYTEYQPSALLKQYVYRFWTLSLAPDCYEDQMYRIISDGCVDLIFTADEKEQILITGTPQSPNEIPVSKADIFLGVRFLPGTLHYFFNLPVNEIVDVIVPLREVITGDFRNVYEKVSTATEAKDKIKHIEEFLLKRIINSAYEPDLRVLKTIHDMYRSDGNIPLEKNQIYGITSRQLRRLFYYYIGVSPKTFGKIVRFQSVLRSITSTSDRSFTSLDSDFGYYDQSHFIREFKQLTGFSPSAFLGE
jgi:AraC-like DNA-binding protein